MKPEDQIKALAELDGWNHITDQQGGHWWARNGEPAVRIYDLPPYLTSYDAIIPLIQRLDSGDAVRNALRRKMNNYYPFSATPAQLCEALLRATGKWTE